MTMIDMPQATELRKRLRVSRLLAELEQDEMAAAIGVSRGTVSNWERGRSEPGATYFVRWARVTGVTLEWLAESVNAETAPTEVEAVSSLSQHSVRPKGLEPLTFCFGDTASFWTPERALSLAAMWCQVEPDAEIAYSVGSAS